MMYLRETDKVSGDVNIDYFDDNESLTDELYSYFAFMTFHIPDADVSQLVARFYRVGTWEDETVKLELMNDKDGQS